MGSSLQAVVSLVILLVLATSEVSSENPGLQIRILQNGISMAARVATDKLAGEVNHRALPNVSGRSGKTTYTLHTIKITSFRKPASSVNIRPQPGLTWTASNGALTIQGNWHYRTKFLFFRIRDGGRFYISCSGIYFSISVKIGKDSSGRPTVHSTGCSSRINSVSVRIAGSWLSFIYNLLFKGRISRELKRQALKQMCEAAETFISEDLQRKLSEVDVMTNIGKEMVLDYRLVQGPTFGTGYIQSQHKGEIRAKRGPAAFRSQPVPFPSATRAPPRMVNVWGSDYVINSFAFSAFNMGLVQYNLTAQDIPPNYRQYLRTSCSAPAICLGTVLSGVNETYPGGSEVVLNLKATRVPLIHTSPSGIKLTLLGQVVLYVPTATGQDTLFKFGLLINTTLSVSIDDHTVHAKIASLSAEFNTVESTSGTIPDTVLQFLFDQFAKPVILKNLNEVGQKGIDIPYIKGTKFRRPALILNEGSMLLAADVSLAG